MGEKATGAVGEQEPGGRLPKACRDAVQEVGLGLCPPGPPLSSGTPRHVRLPGGPPVSSVRVLHHLPGRQPRAHGKCDLSGLLLGSRPGRWPTMGNALKQ